MENLKSEGRILPERITQEQTFESPQKHLVLPTRFVGKFKVTETTPNVNNVEHWIAQNTGAVTITDFLRGQEGQHLYILGDGNTTLQHGTNIFTVAGANLLLAANIAYHLVRFNGNWYQI